MELDDIFEGNSNSSRNVVYCPYCSKYYYYTDHKKYFEENTLWQCKGCKK